MTGTEILDITDVGPDLIELRLRIPQGFDAYPGQFILVTATIDGEEIGRHYTVSSPYTTDSLEITVETVSSGLVSQWMAELQPGDCLRIDGPFGRTHYTGTGSVVVLVSGPGIGAGIAVAERAIAEGNEATLYYQTRAYGYESRLAELSRNGGTVYISSSGGIGSIISRSEFEKGFVFGFREFIDRVRRELTASGFDPDQFEYENYGYRSSSEDAEDPARF